LASAEVANLSELDFAKAELAPTADPPSSLLPSASAEVTQSEQPPDLAMAELASTAARLASAAEANQSGPARADSP
jgi:hypothetical protein